MMCIQAHFSVIVVGDKDTTSTQHEGETEDEIGALYGTQKEIIRMSEELVEAAFDGDIGMYIFAMVIVILCDISLHEIQLHTY